MKLRDTVLNGATALAVACALGAVIGAYRRGTLFQSQPTPQSRSSAPKYVPNWREYLATGNRIGPPSARLTIVEFGDFECPACAGFARRLDTLRQRYPDDFAVVFHHFPLGYHKLAYPLARASECAAAQGKFVQFHDAVYAHPESVAIKGITNLGAVAGVGDKTRFVDCVNDSTRVAAVERDLNSALRIGIPGTPGIIIDGYLRGERVTNEELEGMIKARRAGKSPQQADGGGPS
jgi:protein-disulfide isomerase